MSAAHDAGVVRTLTAGMALVLLVLAAAVGLLGLGVWLCG